MRLAFSGWRFVQLAYGETFEALLAGLQAGLFAARGVPEVVRLEQAWGKAFDPHYHEAFGFVNKPGFEEGAVADVLQAGFLLGDKVLRTAKVRLQKGEPKSTEA